MRILIVTPHFYPENFKCNDMAFELQRRGNEVSVMTAIPDYPKGKFFEGYGIFKKRREVLHGVKVHRSFIIPRGNGSSIRLVLNYLSYTLFSTFKALWLGLTHKYDVIIVHETSPIMVGIPAIFIKKIQKLPLHFWILDLWPESLSAAGGITNKYILCPFEKLTRWIYENSDTLLIGSKGYRKSIESKGNYSHKIKYFPNWVEDSLKYMNRVNVPELPSGFNVMIAGNMGDAQDLPHVLDAITKVKNKSINIIFVGDGRRRRYVEDFVKDNSLGKNVFCLGRYPLSYMPALFEKTDILFMALKDEPIFALTCPSRLQAYMSSGKPIVAMINGDGADLIKEADCGWSVNAENSDALAQIFDDVSIMDKSILKEKGLNGKSYSQEHFDFNRCINELEKIIRKERNDCSDF
jgi:glycosyltransferase involved in cell wall biosynthesis